LRIYKIGRIGRPIVRLGDIGAVLVRIDDDGRICRILRNPTTTRRGGLDGRGNITRIIDWGRKIGT